MQAAQLDLLLRIYILLASASNMRQEQCQFAIKAQNCGVLLLRGGISVSDNSSVAGEVAATLQTLLRSVQVMLETSSYCQQAEI